LTATTLPKKSEKHCPSYSTLPRNIQKPWFGKLSREFTVKNKRTLLLGRFLGDLTARRAVTDSVAKALLLSWDLGTVFLDDGRCRPR
jgi:hypothetical protein